MCPDLSQRFVRIEGSGTAEDPNMRISREVSSSIDDRLGVARVHRAEARVHAYAAPRRNVTRDPDAELLALAQAAGPLRRALARVAGRMVVTRGWERLGSARLG